MKRRASERERKRKKGAHKWEPNLREAVLLREHHISDAARGVTAKFQRPYEGPYLITQIIISPTFEISDQEGKFRGTFNKRLLKGPIAYQ
jgi:hypothetical protein